jgi:hypothetical protein
MKKSISLKTIIPTVIALIAVISAVTFLFINSALKISAGEANEPGEIKLHVGKYMHTSGDETQYVEVFEDNTIQIVGLPYYEYSMNLPENLENAKTWDEEGREHYQQFLKDMEEYLSQRHPYRIISIAKIVVFLYEDGEPTSRGIFIDDENTLRFTEDFIYVYKG